MSGEGKRQYKSQENIGRWVGRQTCRDRLKDKGNGQIGGVLERGKSIDGKIGREKEKGR